jgi:hypothetical protein
MIEIIDNSNKLVAEADSLENAIFALRTLVPEEKCDLRAVGADGATLAVGFHDPGVAVGYGTAGLRVVVTQGTQRKQVYPRPFAPTRLDERD